MCQIEFNIKHNSQFYRSGISHHYHFHWFPQPTLTMNGCTQSANQSFAPHVGMRVKATREKTCNFTKRETETRREEDKIEFVLLCGLSSEITNRKKKK